MNKIQNLLEEFQTFVIKHKPLDDNEYAETYLRVSHKGLWNVVCEKFDKNIPPDEFSWVIGFFGNCERIILNPEKEWQKGLNEFRNRITQLLERK